MRRTNAIFGAVSIAALLAALYSIFFTNSALTTAAAGKDLAEQVSEACAKGGAAAAQLGDICRKANEVKEQPAAGAQGAKGDTGPQGPQGAPGAQGPKGDRGTDGQSPPCLADPAHCQGAAGANGLNGTQGPAGADGQPGATGPAGPQGPAGPAGPQGEQGPAGQNGEPPAGWTSTYPDGSTQTCTRAKDFDAKSPQYTCTNSGPKNPVPLVRK